MDVKFSQMPLLSELKDFDTFPLLSEDDNYIAPMYAIYNYLSGDKIIQLYTSYSTNSSYLLQSANLANSVYTQYFTQSGFYVLNTSYDVSTWRSNYNNSRSLSASWTDTRNTVNSISATLLQSDNTLVPNSSAIKNIVAITQANYDLLTYIDPQTFYVIAS